MTAPRCAAVVAAAAAVGAAVGGGGLATGCRLDPPGASARAPATGPRVAPPRVELLSCLDLPRDDGRTHNLSGLAWDPATRTLLAISDKDKLLVELVPRADFGAVSLGPATALDIDLDDWDGEALAIAGNRLLLVANETMPAVFSVDRSGRDPRRIELPAFPGIRHNVGLEGLGYFASSDGRFVFAVNEQALAGDGDVSTTAHGTVVRILRHALDGGRADLEVAYLTEPVFAEGVPSDNGVSDLAPLSADRVLVLERGFVQGKGNAIRIYDVDLRGAQNVMGFPDARAGIAVHKRLVVDLARLPDHGCSPPPAPQTNRILENYEGLAVGPRLDDGRRVLFLVSDDNFRLSQIPRLIAVAVAPGAL